MLSINKKLLQFRTFLLYALLTLNLTAQIFCSCNTYQFCEALKPLLVLLATNSILQAFSNSKVKEYQNLLKIANVIITLGFYFQIYQIDEIILCYQLVMFKILFPVFILDQLQSNLQFILDVCSSLLLLNRYVLQCSEEPIENFVQILVFQILKSMLMNYWKRKIQEQRQKIKEQTKKNRGEKKEGIVLLEKSSIVYRNKFAKRLFGNKLIAKLQEWKYYKKEYNSQLENKIWDDIQNEYVSLNPELTSFGSVLCDLFDCQNRKNTKHLQLYGQSIMKQKDKSLYLLVIQDITDQLKVQQQFSEVLSKRGSTNLDSPGKSTLLKKRKKRKGSFNQIQSNKTKFYLDDYEILKKKKSYQDIQNKDLYRSISLQIVQESCTFSIGDF